LAGFDAVVLATGITPRRLDLPGADHPKVAAYDEILSGRRQAGATVAILGAGGIGFDVASFLIGDDEDFAAEWGIDPAFGARGGLTAAALPPSPRRRIVLMQRKPGRPGAGLGKTTGWIHKAHLLRHGVEMLAGVSYHAIDDAGLHIGVDGGERVIAADTVITCIGQEPDQSLLGRLRALGKPVHLIGGARDATRLDALAAFVEGTRMGLDL